MTDSEALTTADREEISRLIAVAEQVDGVRPVNESAEFVLAGDRPGELWFERIDDRIVGLALFDGRESTIMLAVEPSVRRRGIGGRLLRAALAAHPGAAVWSFGTLPAAGSLATRLGLTATRRLFQLARPLGNEDPVEVPEGYRITTFAPEDADGLVEVNRLAFAHHPEQGRLTVAEFWDIAAQPWFSPEGLFLAKQGDEVVGFHWTKRHSASDGEVYVLAVHPDHGGAGLGRALLSVGLAHLERIGCERVFLYVEAAQERVVRLYRSANFEQVNVDTSYHLQEG